MQVTRLAFASQAVKRCLQHGYASGAPGTAWITNPTVTDCVPLAVMLPHSAVTEPATTDLAATVRLMFQLFTTDR